MDKKIDHDYTHDIVCPACGYIMSNPEKYDYDDGDEIDCDCGAAYFVEKFIDIRYCTVLKGEEKNNG